MKFLKQLPTAFLALTLCTALAACGGAAQSSSAAAGGTPSADTSAGAASPAGTSAGAASSAQAGGTQEFTATITVGASPSPHAQILEQVKPILAEQGINLEIVEYTDYVIPNMALSEEDIDANYFQHYPYLENFNEENGTDLISAVAVHFEPLSVYAGKAASIDALPEGGTIAIPSDPTNEARALQLLQALGVIELKEGVGLNATPIDITTNAKNIQFQEIEAAQVPRVLPDVDLAVINGNYALEGNVTDKAVAGAAEGKDAEGAKEYANILAVRKGDEERPEIKALIEALTSDTVKSYIETTFNGLVIPVF